MRKKRVTPFRFRLRWKDHFSFSGRELRGLYLLLIFLSVEISWLYYLRYIRTASFPADWPRWVQIADSMAANVENAVDSTPHRRPYRPTNEVFVRRDSLFPFNPNLIGLSEWMKLGLSPRQAAAVLNYRKRGGVFRIKSDLFRLSVVKRIHVNTWLPYVQLPDSLPVSAPAVPLATVDIYRSDSAAFERLRGVGPSMAGRIVRYRERLGGFFMVEQVQEVYGMSDSLWLLVRPQLKEVGMPVLRKIDLNLVPADLMNRHPYIGYRLSEQIDRYRRQHPFTRVDELRRLPLFSEEIYRKLAPYLTIGE